MSKQKKEKVEKIEVKEKKEKIGLCDRLMRFFRGVKVESKRIHWTRKKDLVKYSISTLIFVIFFSLFFYFIDVVYAFLHSLIG